jgi:hypothetical protein
MTPGPGFDLAAALPFAVPGPTNTLVAIGSARRRRAARAGRRGAGRLRRGGRGLDRTRRTRTRRPQRTPQIPVGRRMRPRVRSSGTFRRFKPAKSNTSNPPKKPANPGLSGFFTDD